MALRESAESHYLVKDLFGKTVDVVSTNTEAEKLGDSIQWLETGDQYIDAAGNPNFHGFSGDGLHA